MQTLQSVAIILALSMAAQPSLVRAEPVLTPATFNTVYSPGGFDSNDIVQIVGEGMFRNTCYRPALTTVAVDHEKKTIRLGPVAYEYPGLCLQVVLPFERVIDVGILKPGTYKITQDSGETLGSVKVAQAKTLEPDDFMYAPISQAFFKQKGLKSEVMLTGDFPSSCMSLKEVRVAIEEKAIVLQPIAGVEERGDCKAGAFPFHKLVEIDLVPPGRYLLHVRSMNSKAINTLVTVN